MKDAYSRALDVINDLAYENRVLRANTAISDAILLISELKEKYSLTELKKDANFKAFNETIERLFALVDKETSCPDSSPVEIGKQPLSGRPGYQSRDTKNSYKKYRRGKSTRS